MGEIIIREAKADDVGQLLNYMKKIGGETDNLTYGPEGMNTPIEKEAAFLESVALMLRLAMLI